MSSLKRASVVIRRAIDSDLSAIEGLLLKSSLPIDGVRDALGGFLIAEQESKVVGVAGVEERDGYGLLRSVAIDEGWRSQGLGRELVERAIAAAEAMGLKSLYLLTTTAEWYFPTFGFTLTTRDKVPDALQQTPEFQGACPASAVVMVRPVGACVGGER